MRHFDVSGPIENVYNLGVPLRMKYIMSLSPCQIASYNQREDIKHFLHFIIIIIFKSLAVVYNTYPIYHSFACRHCSIVSD